MHIGARITFFILVGLSIWSVSIIIESNRVLKSFEKMDGIIDAENLILARNWSALKEWSTQKEGLHSGTIRAALATGTTEPAKIDRSIRSYLSLKKADLEKGLTPLATLGSNAPFIGLFGTVLGIIQAFGALGGNAQGGDTSTIMVGISEALVATAIGLFVAIPSVISYNYLSRKLRLIFIRCEAIRDLYLSRIE